MSPIPLETTGDLLLVLPFTPALLRDPAPLLAPVFTAAQRATRTVTVVFTTPGKQQLYPVLRAAPRRHFEAVQHFLGKVYSALAAGHWAADRILVDVEVHFDGELGEWPDKLLAKPERVIRLDSHSDLGAAILAAAAPGVQTVAVSSAPLPSPGEFPARVDEPGWGVVAMGGTFDHLHAAHKLLLQAALFITETRLICGVISPKLLASKSNAHVIESLETRLGAVNGFLARLGLGDRIPYVVEIMDGLGPTAWDPEVTAIAVSRETMGGGKEVNRVRGSKGLCTLDILSVDVISATLESDAGENILRTVDLGGVSEEDLKHVKMGSTGIREWLAKREQTSPTATATATESN